MFKRRTVMAGLAATLTAMATPGLAQNAYNIEGPYTAYGMNADGSKYSGAVQILQNGNSVDVYWNVAGQNYSGKGVVQGSVVTVDWGASTPVIYVLVGNELHGTWDGGRALERLVRQ